MPSSFSRSDARTTRTRRRKTSRRRGFLRWLGLALLAAIAVQMLADAVIAFARQV